MKIKRTYDAISLYLTGKDFLKNHPNIHFGDITVKCPLHLFS